MGTLAALIKHIHVWLVVLSIGSFGICYLISQHNAKHRLDKKLIRIAPHIIDSLLVATGVALVFLYGISPLQANWLAVKVVLVAGYIALRHVAVHSAMSRRPRQLAAGCALAAVLSSIFLSVYKPTLV